MKSPAPHLDDVAVGVLGVCADKHREEGRDSVVRSDGLQDLLEVVLVPWTSDIPPTELEDTPILDTPNTRGTKRD